MQVPNQLDIVTIPVLTGIDRECFARTFDASCSLRSSLSGDVTPPESVAKLEFRDRLLSDPMGCSLYTPRPEECIGEPSCKLKRWTNA